MINRHKNRISIFWFRRDLRIEDNHALYLALKGSYQVQPIFIFDKNILLRLEEKDDARVSFIHREIQRINQELEKRGSTLLVYFGKPIDIWQRILSEWNVENVYANRDYEPYAVHRDDEISRLLKDQGIPFITAKDHVIFEKDEIVKDDGKPYMVFTPYSYKWKSKFRPELLDNFPSDVIENWNQDRSEGIPDLSDLGFINTNIVLPEKRMDNEIIKQYHETRDLPGIRGTSRIGVHLRFGTMSIREAASVAFNLNEKFLNELIWREFYSSILWHFPESVDHNFYRKYDGIKWLNDEDQFRKWCNGQTGYPMVDAGMRELNVTGYMHNRVRMIVSSFLTKHLLIDWRWGEAYFAAKLLDYEQASNVGGWQWAAGTGVDAAPYFRVFNPELQLKKFDPDLVYIKKWIPEIGSRDYPQPVVDHKFARARAIETYRIALNNQ